MLRVLVISPYPTSRAGLRALLEPSGEVEVTGSAGELRLDEDSPPDVVLLDDADAWEVVQRLEEEAPGTGIVLLGGSPGAMHGGRVVGPRGYLTRDATAGEILAAVRAVAEGLTVVDPARTQELVRAASLPTTDAAPAGSEQLTPRELEVLQLLAGGLPNKAIAHRLGISDHTAKFHVSQVLAKLGAASRTEAVTTAARQGLLLL